MILMQGATLDGVIYFAAASLMVFFFEKFQINLCIVYGFDFLLLLHFLAIA